MKTVLITGSSSGIGKAAVIEFAKRGWNVAATMRKPEKEKDFDSYKNVKLYSLDVTDSSSINKAFSDIISDFGRIDAVVNNAGFGVDGVFEAMSDEIIQKQFETNVFGLMRMSREAIKHMRESGGGKIIQIASMGGRLAFPLYSLYHSSKWAVEGFSESLHYELVPFNIQVKIIEPGIIKTEFTGRSRTFVKPDYTNVYDDYLDNFAKVANKTVNDAIGPETVAQTIFQAANDNSSKLRYPVGKPAPLLLFLRKIVSDSLFATIVRKSYNI